MSARARSRASPERRPARARIARARKRDGREVPFEPGRIAASVAAAMEAAGEPDPSFAAEVAEVVVLALCDRAAGRRAAEADEPPPEIVPETREIGDLVERVLVELGRAGAAKAYILDRDRRARIQDALSVEEPRGATAVRVRESGGSSPWSKGRITAALVEEAELPRETAAEVAARVERRVFASGLRRVSSALVRELVDLELVELGLTAALSRQRAVALPRHDLRRALAGAPVPWEEEREAGRSERTLDERVAAEVLRRYALEDVLGDALAELHLAGDLWVEDLGRPHLPLALGIDAGLLLSGTPGPGSAAELVSAAAPLARATGRWLVLEEPGPVLAPLLRAARGPSERTPGPLAGVLRALGAVAAASGRRIALGSPGRRHAQLAEALLVELAALPPGTPAPVLFLDEEELARAVEPGSTRGAAPAEAAEALLAAGLLVPTYGEGGEGAGAGERCVGPGLHRHARERGALACGGAVALNLPRLARRAGPWREDLFLAALSDLVRCAVEALGRLQAFQGEARAGGPRGAGLSGGGLAARVSYALVPVGLREALLVLGDGEPSPELGSRVLGLAAEAARRFAPEVRTPVLLTPFFAETARRRLARLDRRAEGAQPALFADAPAPPRPYGAGPLLSPVRGLRAGEAEAELRRTVPAGALPLDLLPAAGDEPHPRLAAWRRAAAPRLLAPRGAEEGPAATLFPFPRARRAAGDRPHPAPETA